MTAAGPGARGERRLNISSGLLRTSRSSLPTERSSVHRAQSTTVGAFTLNSFQRLIKRGCERRRSIARKSAGRFSRASSFMRTDDFRRSVAIATGMASSGKRGLTTMVEPGASSSRRRFRTPAVERTPLRFKTVGSCWSIIIRT